MIIYCILQFLFAAGHSAQSAGADLRPIDDSIQRLPSVEFDQRAPKIGDLIHCAWQGEKCECNGRVRYGLDTTWTDFYEVNLSHFSIINGEVDCESGPPFDTDPNYGNLHSMYSKECQCEVISLGSKSLQEAQATRKVFVGVGMQCPQGAWCNCPGGRMRMGSATGTYESGGKMGEQVARWTDWVYVRGSPMLLCDAEVFSTVNGWENTVYTGKYCECERVMTKEGMKRLQPGTKLYAFKVGYQNTESDLDPREVLTDRQIKMVQNLADRARAKSASGTTESHKQLGVTGVGVAAGIGISAAFAPLIIPVILHGGFLAASGVVVGSSTGQYLATTGVKHGTKFVLQTEDRYENMLSLQDGVTEVAVNCATAGIVTLPGLDHAIRAGATQGVDATSAVLTKVGDHALIHTRGQIAEGISALKFSIHKMLEAGMEVVVDEDGMVTIGNPDEVPTIMSELTGMGILLNIILNNIHTQGAIQFGHHAYVEYEEMNRDLDAMRNSALEIVQQSRGPNVDENTDMWVRLGVAERLLAKIVHPTYATEDYKSKPQGKRFPSYNELKVKSESVDANGAKRITNQIDGETGASRVPLCYCWKHGYKAEQGPPILGVDVDFCLHGQRCAEGSGAENAVCIWQDSSSKQVAGRMFQAVAEGHLNCFGQHLDGYRCGVCAHKTGKSCMTELGLGTCQTIPKMPGAKKESKPWLGDCWGGLMGTCKKVSETTCLRPGETIDANGRKSGPSAPTNGEGAGSSSDDPCTPQKKTTKKMCDTLKASAKPATRNDAEAKSCLEAYAACEAHVSESNITKSNISLTIGIIIFVVMLLRLISMQTTKETELNYSLIEDEI